VSGFLMLEGSSTRVVAGRDGHPVADRSGVVEMHLNDDAVDLAAINLLHGRLVMTVPRRTDVDLEAAKAANLPISDALWFGQSLELSK